MRCQYIAELLIVLLGFMSRVEGRDLLFIYGGCGSTEHEFYVGHLEDEISCNPDPKYYKQAPFRENAASTFVPEVGIFLCGGKSKNSGIKEENRCYYVNRESGNNWNFMNFTGELFTDGLRSMSLHTLDYPVDAQRTTGLLMAGGYYTNKDNAPNLDTFMIRDVRSDPPSWLPNPPNLTTGPFTVMGSMQYSGSYSKNRQNTQVFVMLSDDMYYTCYCTEEQTSICPLDRWECKPKSYPSEKYNITVSSAATIRMKNNTEAILFSALEGSNNLILSISISGWTQDGPSFSFVNLPVPNYQSKAVFGGVMVSTEFSDTYDRVFYFGGKTEQSEALATVFELVDFTVWEERPPMKTPRICHTVVVVPEKWICEDDSHCTEQSTTTAEAGCPVGGVCSKVDSRGTSWTTGFGTLAEQDCPSDADNNGEGRALWYCDGCLGDFNTSEPDRSACVANWVAEVENLLENGTSSLLVSETLKKNLLEASSATTGGTITQTKDLLARLLQKRSEDAPDGDNFHFTESVISSTDAVLRSTTGWQELGGDAAKHKTISSYLASLDYTGFLWAEREKSVSKSDCGISQAFRFASVSVESRTVAATAASRAARLAAGGESECFRFADQGEICVPNADLQDGCNVLVGTLVSIKQSRVDLQSSIFPSYPDSFNNQGLVSQQLIGLTVNNNGQTSLTANNNGRTSLTANNNGRTSLTAINNGQSSREASNLSIQITFVHEDIYSEINGCWFLPRTPQCVFWNTMDHSWSSEGCQFESGGWDETVCVCSHLTNFGIVLDWSGEAPASDPVLSGISICLLTASCLSLVLAEGLLYLQRKDHRSRLRKMAETNRNISLFLAQVLFMACAGSYESVSCSTCQVFGAFTHYFWLTFFTWTAIEGYFFYTALVTVFETNNFRRLLFYGAGYALPAVIVAATVIVGETTNKYVYLRRNVEGRINSCWLNDAAMSSILVPVGLVIIFNAVITIIAITIAYKASKRRNPTTRARIVGTMRNTLLISLLLGLTWTVGFLPTSTAQQYISVILNSSMGIYILYYSVLANTQVRGDLKERVSHYISTSNRIEKSTKDTDDGATTTRKGSSEVPPRAASLTEKGLEDSELDLKALEDSLRDRGEYRRGNYVVPATIL